MITFKYIVLITTIKLVQPCTCKHQKTTTEMNDVRVENAEIKKMSSVLVR